MIAYLNTADGVSDLDQNRHRAAGPNHHRQHPGVSRAPKNDQISSAAGKELVGPPLGGPPTADSSGPRSNFRRRRRLPTSEATDLGSPVRRERRAPRGWRTRLLLWRRYAARLVEPRRVDRVFPAGNRPARRPVDHAGRGGKTATSDLRYAHQQPPDLDPGRPVDHLFFRTRRQRHALAGAGRGRETGTADYRRGRGYGPGDFRRRPTPHLYQCPQYLDAIHAGPFVRREEGTHREAEHPRVSRVLAGWEPNRVHAARRRRSADLTIATDGTDMRQLTRGKGKINRLPRWSADGSFYTTTTPIRRLPSEVLGGRRRGEWRQDGRGRRTTRRRAPAEDGWSIRFSSTIAR